MKRARDPAEEINGRNVRRNPVLEELDPRGLPLDITRLLLSEYMSVADIIAISQTSVFLNGLCHIPFLLPKLVACFIENCRFSYMSDENLSFMSKLVPFVRSYVHLNGPLLPGLLKSFAGLLVTAIDSRPVDHLAIRILPYLDAPSQKLFQTYLLKSYQNDRDDIDYYYEHNDLVGACCKMPIRTRKDLDTLYGPLLLGSSIEDQVFVLLWAFNLLDFENLSMSVIVPLTELEPYRPFISGALERIARLLSLAFALLGESDPFRQPFVDFFISQFDIDLPEVSLQESIEADPTLMFSVFEVIWAMHYKDHSRIPDLFWQLLKSSSPSCSDDLLSVYQKWSTVMDVVETGETIDLPFECELQKHLYKIIWLSKHRLSQCDYLSKLMKTPLKVCMDSTLDLVARDWLISTILMLSPDSHVYNMILIFRLGQRVLPDGPMWLQLFPSSNAMLTFFTLLERINEDDLDMIFDIWATFERIVQEFRVAYRRGDQVGMELFDDACKMEPFVRVLRTFAVAPDQAFLQQARPSLFPLPAETAA